MPLPISHISSIEDGAVDYLDARANGTVSLLKTGKSKLDEILLGGLE